MLAWYVLGCCRQYKMKTTFAEGWDLQKRRKSDKIVPRLFEGDPLQRSWDGLGMQKEMEIQIQKYP